MIVKQKSEGWEIIFQRAHATLAAQIAFYWKEEFRPARWLETLIAIAAHDDAQLDFTGAQHLTKSGSPLDFTMKEINLYQPLHNSEYAWQKSRWIGLLNSLHISFLYEGKKGLDKRLDVILSEQHELQKKLMDSLKISNEEACRSYRLLEWCDALSLILCRGLIQPEERKMEVSEGPEGTRHMLWQRKSDQSLVVEPWCFQSEEFIVSVECRELTQMTFTDDAELKKLLQQSEVKEKHWLFKK